MPPKREPVAFIAVPEAKAAPPNPLVLAAQIVVDKWNQRLSEARARVEECNRHIRQSERAAVDNENMIGTLLQQATDLIYPKEVKEVVVPQVITAGGKSGSVASPKSTGKTGPTPLQPVVSETLVPAPPPMTEAQLKKKAKQQANLLNAYKKKKYVPTADEIALGATISSNVAASNGDAASTGQPSPLRAGDVRPSRPNDVKDELWESLMTLRDNRIDCEDKVIAFKQQAEMLRQRLTSLVEMERVTRYAVIAAENELTATTQRVEEAARLAKEQAKLDMENKASRPSSSFGGAHSVVNAPMAQASTSMVSPRAAAKK